MQNEGFQAALGWDGSGADVQKVGTDSCKGSDAGGLFAFAGAVYVSRVKGGEACFSMRCQPVKDMVKHRSAMATS